MRFPQPPPQIVEAPSDLAAWISANTPTLPDGRYLHWDDFRRRKPPAGLTIEQAWAATKLARLHRTPIEGFVNEHGRTFSIVPLEAIAQATHELDRQEVDRAVLGHLREQTVRREYRTRQLVEEAIRSSVFEGAKLTTRAHAREMLLEGRAPTTRGERMVVNNYLAIERLLEMAAEPDRKLVLDDLLELHAVLGDGVLDTKHPSPHGRLRRAHESVRVEDSATGEIWYTPPHARTLPRRLEAMLAFANGETRGRFVHPVLAAITLHFWLAWLHPFVDGNGRMARALFYWRMLRGGYEIAQYLSISGPLERAPTKYYRAFIHTETDDADLTYFVLHQLDVLHEATDELVQSLGRRAEHLSRQQRLGRIGEDLNDRQRAALHQLTTSSHGGLTIGAHESTYEVSYLTARKDLQELEAKGLLRRVRAGRAERYVPTDKLRAKLGD